MENKRFNLDEFIKSGAVILTPQNVCDVIGKEIETSYPVYRLNEPRLVRSKVIRLTTQWELAKETYTHEGETHAEYWERALPSVAAKAKNTIMLQTTEDCFELSTYFGEEEPFFCGNDADRPVYFKLVK